MKTLQDLAYETLYNLILKLDLEPGQRVSDREFEERLGMSRTPIREAMLRLTRNGLLNSVPQSGTFVTKINLAQTLDARFVRQTMERKIVNELVNNHTEQGIEDLEFILFEQRRNINRNELKEFFETDDKFHATLYELTGHRSVWNWLTLISNDLNRFRYLRLFDNNLPLEPLFESHQKLVNALRESNATAADQIIEQHLDLQLDDKKEVTQQYPQYFDL